MGFVPVFVTSTSMSSSQSSFFASFNFSGFLILNLIGRCFGILSATSRSSFSGSCARPGDSPHRTTSEDERARTRAAAFRRRNSGRRP